MPQPEDEAVTVQVGLLTTAEPIAQQISTAAEALKKARTLLDASSLAIVQLSNLDAALEEVGAQLDDLSSDIGAAIAKA